MSWDILIFAMKEPPPPMEQMPEDWGGESLGSAQSVREKISACFPKFDWSDQAWGIFEGDGFSLEFNLGESESINDPVMVHVRGGGDAIAALIKLSEHTGWFLLDISQSEWIHHCKDEKA
jgi:hypothetical protein